MESDEKRLRRILDHLYDGVYVVNLKRQIQLWNRASEEISGFSASEVLGKCCADNILQHVDAEGNSLCSAMCPLAKTMADGQPRENEVYLRHKSGHRVPVHVRVTPLLDDAGAIIGAVEIFNDNTSQIAFRRRLEEITNIAMKDPLTGLTNRRYMELEISRHLAQYQRKEIGEFGVLFIDLDNFKGINDTFGHEAGDLVLKMVSQTLANSLRQRDLLGRWGGDEFIAIIDGVDTEQLAVIANRACVLTSTTWQSFNGVPCSPTISIGVTLVHPGDTQDCLLRRADEAMYQSKKAGRNQITFT
ncbi:MAG: diguanylate cyclase [Anaerolineaceae bacterium]